MRARISRNRRAAQRREEVEAGLVYDVFVLSLFSSFLPVAKPAGQGMIFGLLLLLSGKICQIEHYGGHRSTGTWVIEATEFKFEVRSDL